MMNYPALTKPPARYYTSLEACSCPDYVYRPGCGRASNVSTRRFYGKPWRCWPLTRRDGLRLPHNPFTIANLDRTESRTGPGLVPIGAIP